MNSTMILRYSFDYILAMMACAVEIHGTSTVKCSSEYKCTAEYADGQGPVLHTSSVASITYNLGKCIYAYRYIPSSTVGRLYLALMSNVNI